MPNILFTSIVNEPKEDVNSVATMPFYEAFVETLPNAVYTCDAHGLITYYNKAAALLWGREPELNKELWCGSWKLYTSNGEPMAISDCPMAKCLKEHTTISGEELIIEREDGTRRTVLAYPVPLYNNNALTGAFNTLIDITEQKRGEEHQQLLAAIIESSHDAIVSKGLDGVIRSWNHEAENLFGYTSEEAVGKHISLIIPKERLDEETLIIERIKSGQKVDHFDTVRVRKDGTFVNISLTVSPVRDKKGKIVGASKIARNITAQKELEERMQRHTRNLQIINTLAKTIAENLETKAILQKVTDATTQLIEAAFGAFFYNVVDEKGEAYMLYTLSGAPREAFENIGMPRNTKVFATTFNGEGILRVDDIRKDERYGQNAPYIGMPQGHLPVVSYLAVPVFSKSGEVIGGLFYGHPEAAKFTEEHEALITGIASQAALALDNARLFEEVQGLNMKKDEFIGLASHELKTPVTGISGYLQILERTLPDDHVNKSFVRKAVQQTNKLSLLISDLLDISKIHTGKMPLNFTTFELYVLLKDVCEMMEQSNPNYTIEMQCDQKDLVVVGDRQRIEQVVINLVSNAIKYSPDANRVVITATVQDNIVKVAVQDFGLGISLEDQKLIFQRFYRAKSSALHISGLGIGLYISNEIISRHQGQLTVTSTLGEGSVFTFTMPVSQE